MSKLILLIGLPASGKSTIAKDLLAKDGNAVRLNKDLMREMLHFNKWSGNNEGITRDASRSLAKMFLADHKNVIIDDTNLNERTVQGWKDLAKESDATLEYVNLDTPWYVCVERDAKREKKVGESVIIQMALQSGRFEKPPKGIVICDLDGTLCDISARLHYVKRPEGEKKDWKGFFSEIANDTPRPEVLAMIKKYEDEGHFIFFVSGRPDTYRDVTEKWLDEVFPDYTALLMRKGNDKRPDTEVKEEILQKYFPDKSWIYKVIDDRPSVVRMWQKNGLDVIDVGNGIDF